MRVIDRFAALLLIVCATMVVACSDDDPTGPTRESVAGSYAATTMTATLSGISIDLLAAGGSLTASFAANGTVTGRLIVPDLSQTGEDVDEQLVGTWQLDGGVVDVQFTTGSDTFVEDMDFTVVGNTLVGDETFDGVRVQVVLTKL